MEVDFGEAVNWVDVTEKGGLKMGGVNTYCTVDGTNPAPVDIHLIIYRVSYIPEGAGFLPSTVLLYLVD